MITLTSFLKLEWLDLIATAMLHSLWQGTLLALLYLVIRRVCSSSQLRYVVSVLIHFIMRIRLCKEWQERISTRG